MSNSRLFVGNVCPKATKDELEGHLSKYGSVRNVDIKEKKDIDGNVLSTFAFVDIIASKPDLDKCVEECSGSDWWKGYRVKVQVAKESFMSRLAKERESSNKKQETVVEARIHKGAPYRKIPIEKEETDFGDKVPDGQSIGGVVQFEDTKDYGRGTATKRPVRKYYSSSSEDDDDEEGVRSKPKTPQYSGGAFMRKLESFDSGFWKEEDEKKGSERETHSEALRNRKLEQSDSLRSSRNNRTPSQNPNLEPLQSDPKERSLGNKNRDKHFANPNLEPLGKMDKTGDKRKFDEIKRVSSLKERQTELQRQKSFISLSLKGKAPNKIQRYDDDESEENESSKKSKLFEESDDEDNAIESFKERPEFDGPSGHHLLGLQSNFGGDNRFKMDHRFADSSGTKAKLKKQPRDKSFKDSTKLRYDPTLNESSSMEVDNAESEEEEEDEEMKESYESSESFSKEKLHERFYDVSKDLKSAFNSQAVSSSPFSLLKAFGQKPSSPTDKGLDSYKTTEIKSDKKKDLFTANPFKYDSSDDDDDNGEENKSKAPSPPVNPTFQSLLRNTNSVSSEKFFFSENDTRFEDGVKFLTSIAEDLQDIRTKYEDERPVLASIFRKKYRNKAQALEQRSRGFGVSKNGKKKGIKIRKKSWNKK